MGRKIETKPINTAGGPKVSFSGLPRDEDAKASDFGSYVQEYHHYCFVNGGHFVHAKLIDPNFNMLDEIIDDSGGWLQKSRKEALVIQSSIKWAEADEKTEKLKTNLINFRNYGNHRHEAFVEFSAIDQPSFVLTNGTKCDGKAYKGTVKEVVEKVVKEYGGDLTIEMSETKDSKENRWYTMRMSPKDFIKAMLDWSCGLTDKKTKWLVYTDDKKIIIKEQAAIESKLRATYKWGGFAPKTSNGNILDWEVLGDHAIGLMANKITVNGISATSGAYLEYSSSVNEKNTGDKRMSVSDATTENKVIPKTKSTNAPTKREPDERGWTSLIPIPEFYGGEIGMNYRDYIDGIARNNYYKTLDQVLKARIRVPGHHIWESCEGLGVDTIKIDWKNIEGEPYWMEGTWIVNGFHHEVRKDKNWYTDLFLSRFDHDAQAKKV